MKQRVITGAVMAAVAIPVFLFSGTVVYAAVLSLLCAVGVFELLRVFSLQKNPAILIPSEIFALAAPLGAYFALVSSSFEAKRYLLLLALAAAVYCLYLFSVAVFAGGTVPFSRISGVFMSVTYVAAGFTGMSVLRYLPDGEYSFLLAFLGACVCDVFAYFTGYLFGKHKLTPNISPKKTVEGSIGGMVFTVLAFVLYGFLLKTFADRTPNYLLLALSGLVLSVVSQIGDLSASLIKREYGIKDYGKLFPGHGGVMDRFDSTVAVALTMMLISVMAPPLI